MPLNINQQPERVRALGDLHSTLRSTAPKYLSNFAEISNFPKSCKILPRCPERPETARAADRLPTVGLPVQLLAARLGSDRVRAPSTAAAIRSSAYLLFG